MARALYPFRFRDPLTGKWVKARYRATHEDIGRRYASAEIIGAGSTPTGVSTGFDPYRKVTPHCDWRHATEPALLLHPPLRDPLERTLVSVFLRRYVTWCARNGRYAAMGGAARLMGTLQRATDAG